MFLVWIQLEIMTDLKQLRKKNKAGDNLEEKVSDHFDLHDRLVVVGIH